MGGAILAHDFTAWEDSDSVTCALPVAGLTICIFAEPLLRLGSAGSADPTAFTLGSATDSSNTARSPHFPSGSDAAAVAI